MDEAEVFVGVGSNIDKKKNIVSAVVSLRAVFGSLRVSPIYRSAAVGFVGDDFYNLVVAFHTNQKPAAVADQLQAIEIDHGRVSKGNQFAARTLDLDQLLYGDLVINDGCLQLPHRQLTSYAFILKPLADLAGWQRHPCLGQSYRSLYQQLQNSLPAVYQVELPELQALTG